MKADFWSTVLSNFAHSPLSLISGATGADGKGNFPPLWAPSVHSRPLVRQTDYLTLVKMAAPATMSFTTDRAGASEAKDGLIGPSHL